MSDKLPASFLAGMMIDNSSMEEDMTTKNERVDVGNAS